MNSLQKTGNRQWSWIAIGLALILVPFRETDAKDQSSFYGVVNRHFNRWTNGGNQALTEHRVNELVLSSDVRGAEAAAIAAIHSYQKKVGHNTHPLTHEFLVTKHTENAGARRDQAAVGAN